MNCAALAIDCTVDTSELSRCNPLSQKDMTKSLSHENVDIVLEFAIGPSELSRCNPLHKSDISSSSAVSCSDDVVLGIINESTKPPLFSPLSKPDVSLSPVPEGVRDLGLEDGKESTEFPSEAEPIAESENVSDNWLLVTFIAFWCSIFSEIILNHFGVK